MKKNIDNISIWLNVIQNSDYLFNKLINDIEWNTKMKSRYTATFGEIYKYSNTEHSKYIPEYLNDIKIIVDEIIGYQNNNILINYYFEGDSKMGFHSDDLTQLENETGVLILSLGGSRILRFKNKLDSNIIFDISLNNNTLLFMNNQIQVDWLHSILPDKESESKRISLTFRNLKSPLPPYPLK
ncbi:alpha-ketoglutarate-dependent dioxygenase AlkB [Empedobacter sp.]|uniref:alpha-ketoglutarate-dependent dioxygenase AlkB n=1 Tax=Empedobacter sp. TaxID=1927715 RepID=UPI0028AD541F|nr:alpha-ketoglutarate-dependent dioxygenase AlkB [Empedobacter sp.]